MIKQPTNILIRKTVFSLITGVASFLVIYFILENIIPKEKLCKIVLTYESASNERARVYVTTHKNSQECNALLIDTLENGSYKETFLFPEITDYDKFRITFSKDEHIAKIYSILFQFNRTSEIWNAQELYSNLKDNRAFTIHEDGIQVSNNKASLFIESQESISNIIQKHRLNRLSKYSLMISFMLMMAFFFLPFTFHRSYSIKEIVLIVFFLSFICTPILIKYQSFSNLERRKLAQKPEFKLKGILSYHRDYGMYFSDNFAFRSILIKLNNNIKFKFFHVSPAPQEVLIGEKNWLFHSGGTSMDFSQNRNLYTIEELEKIKSNLEKKRDWLNQRNIKFYIFVPPIKARVYPEYLPKYLNKINSISKLEQLEDYLLRNSDIRIINPTDELIKGKKMFNTYYSNDTHWTFFGGLIGYNVLLSEIKKDFSQIFLLKLDDFIFEKAESKGNLGNIIGIKQFITIEEDKPIYNHPFVLKYNSDNDSVVKDDDFINPTQLLEYSDTTLLKVVFFRDSFSNFYLEYTGKNFRRGLFLWTHKFKPAIIEKEKPDIVVHEILENHLDHLLYEKVELDKI